MMSFVNGPLGASVRAGDEDIALSDKRIRFCAPDGDVPTPASGLDAIPLLHTLERLAGNIVIVYLECHRAPDEVFAQLESKGVPVVCQGDSECLRPRNCQLFHAALARASAAPRPPAVHLHWCSTLSDALVHCEGGGRCRILVSNRESVRTVMSHLRPNGCLRRGDAVYDKRSKQVACILDDVRENAKKSDVVRLDTGRCTTVESLWPRVVESPCSWGSGECDTLIILPDVCEIVGMAAWRRVRYQVISVGVAPTIYVQAPATGHA